MPSPLSNLRALEGSKLFEGCYSHNLSPTIVPPHPAQEQTKFQCIFLTATKLGVEGKVWHNELCFIHLELEKFLQVNKNLASPGLATSSVGRLLLCGLSLLNACLGKNLACAQPISPISWSQMGPFSAHLRKIPWAHPTQSWGPSIESPLLLRRFCNKEITFLAKYSFSIGSQYAHSHLLLCSKDSVWHSFGTFKKSSNS